MGKIFNKKKNPSVEMAQPPVSQETPGELKEIEKLSDSESNTQGTTNNTNTVEPTPQEVNYREIPVCMSEAQINNLIIENNIMLKQIISSMDD